MLTFFIVILTAFLVLDCLLLGLLILVQLPKKEAGVGMAFGGGAADALFGAGSGNALTKLTKYTAGIFFALVVLLSILNTHQQNSPAARLSRETERLKQEKLQAPVTPAPAEVSAAPATNSAFTINMHSTAPDSNLLTLPDVTNRLVPANGTSTNPPGTGK